MINNYLKNLYKAVENRAFQIECERQLLYEQFCFMDKLKGIEDRIKNLVFFKYSSLTSIHSIYELYLENIKKYKDDSCPFKKAMQCHFSAICILFNPELLQLPQKDKEDELERIRKCYHKAQINLESLEVNQENIKKLMGYDLIKCDESIEKIIETLYFLFPYKELISLISTTNEFFTNLIKAAYDYDSNDQKKSESHIKCLKQVYKSFPTNWNNFNKETILAISEVLLSIFTFQQENQNVQTNIKCFEISERCKYLVKRNLEPLSINPDLISIIEKNLGYQSDKISIEEKKDIKTKSLEYQNDQHSPIMCIHHVALELRKLPLQPSVSFMCVILMRTMNFLNTALCTKEKFVGADESFQFFVGALADARLYHLPRILVQMNSFIVSDLTVGKISFLISQLESAIDFIRRRALPVAQYILFPFKRDDIKALHLVTKEELEKENQILNNPSPSKNYSYVDADSVFQSDSDDEKLVLSGFVICAFPTFLRGKGQIPSVLFCTGDVRDTVVVYRYTFNSSGNNDFFNDNLEKAFQSFDCIHGLIFHMDKKSNYRGFIYVDRQFSNPEISIDEDYANLADDIAEMSNLMLMLPNPSSPSTQPSSSALLSTLPSKNGLHGIHFGGYVSFPETLLLSNLPRFQNKFRIIWGRKKKTDGEKLASDDNSTSSARYYNQTTTKNIPEKSAPITFQTIKELQNLLQKAEKLDHDYIPKGIIDKETVYAIVKTGFIDLCQNFTLTEKDYNSIYKKLSGTH